MINGDRRPRDVVVIGGSAGAIEALVALLGKLPPDLPAAIGVVVHRPAAYVSRLAEVLDRHSTLRVAEPEDGAPLERGRVYLAPRDHHMVLADGRIALDRGPQQHRFRPAVDPLFLSAARTHGPRVVGVLLSGGGADGVRGLVAIKAARGISLVQDPREARNPTMPVNAIAEDDVDAVLPLAEVADALAVLTTGGAFAPALP